MRLCAMSAVATATRAVFTANSMGDAAMSVAIFAEENLLDREVDEAVAACDSAPGAMSADFGLALWSSSGPSVEEA